MSVARNDADGILVDQLVEIRTILDEVWGPAESWPESDDIDGWRWTLTEPQPLEPPADEEGAYEPEPEELAWWDSQPSNQDWDDYRAWCEDYERRNFGRMCQDAEFEARCRFG